MNKLDKKLVAAIKAAAKEIAKVKQQEDSVCKSATESIAKLMDYDNPEEAALEMLMELHEEVIDNSESEWERKLTLYARRQFLDWEKEDLEAEIKLLESERSGLNSN